MDGGGERCSVMNECKNKPKYKGEAYRMLLDNFNFSYFTKRAPVIFALTTQYLIDYPDVKEGIKKFLDEVLDKENVFVVNIQRLLAYMKDPIGLSGIEGIDGLKARKTGNYDCNIRTLAAPVAVADKRLLFDFLNVGNGEIFLFCHTLILIIIFFIVYVFQKVKTA